MKLCLNMIVKNEEKRITRALASAAQFIDSYVIVDTGSTDNTIQVIKEFFAQHGIPGVVADAPFEDWSQARNAALDRARVLQSRFGWDYVLLFDADMELVMKDWDAFRAALAFDGVSYDMEQRSGQLHYANKRLISAKATGGYRGVTHEYVDIPTAGLIGPDIAYFVDHADGANRPNKLKRDIRLLRDGLKKEPDNYRYFFYLAQSYRDDGQTDKAIKWYERRVAAGGWVEEQWNAQVNLAHCWKDKGDEAKFIRNMLIAYNMRPCRAETLYDLATYFRNDHTVNGKHIPARQSIAALFAEVGMTIPRTKDLLFVSDYPYESGLKEEFVITAFYNEQKRQKGFQVCSDLSLQPGPYPSARETARSNIFHYLPKLGDVCPSFKSKRIPFDPPEEWTALNPSVTNHGVDQRLCCIVRTVNYRIDDQGRYLIRGTDGTANDSNPINTRNWLLDMGFDPMTDTKPVAREIMAPPNMPCEFKPVIGFEDMRLFSVDNALWTSSTVRQIHWDGNCEQVLARLEGDDRADTVEITEYKRMLRYPRETEKNWAPIVRKVGPPLWMWRPGTVINEKGEFVHHNPPKLTTDIISGGSQVIPFGPLWIALVHTAHQLPGSPCRYYYHRWAVYKPETLELLALSLPFVFDEKQIEFAAGLAHHPTQKGVLVISYGSRDCEARIATISEAEVARFLWSPKS